MANRQLRTIRSVFDALCEALKPGADLFRSDEQTMEWLHTKFEAESFAEKWYRELDPIYQKSLDALDPVFRKSFPGGWSLCVNNSDRETAFFEYIEFTEEGMMEQDEFGNAGYQIWASEHLGHCGTPSTEAWRIHIEETRTNGLIRRILIALPVFRPVLRPANGRVPKTIPELLERIRDTDLTELVAATPTKPQSSWAAPGASSKGSSGTHDIVFSTSSAGGSASSRTPHSNKRHDLVPEVPPEPQSYWIDIFPIDTSLPAVPECAPEPQSQWIELHPVDSAVNNITESAPEPQSHWIDLVPIDDSMRGTFDAAPEPQSHWIDLYPQVDSSNIPESAPEPASIILELYPIDVIGPPDTTEITPDSQSSG
ncbi:hypothetical protein FIBSPDRAFT_267324 [Athelia psychrophila]|uniref:Uncharacterized protein n=1 Tax=Athelia psychrophila TaxID=1759441 RepID=A0A166RGE4_9AGAM|nr:hypothetical protein FIBSPDRAFT_267324 [Fibularhizoctonia sp. CBS 109695]